MLISRNNHRKEESQSALRTTASGSMMSVSLNVRYSLRRLNNNVGFTVVAVACLALGICASITVFSAVNALLLRPLAGVVDEDRLVSLMPKPYLDEMNDLVTKPLSYPVFQRYREGSHVFSGLVGYQAVTVNLVIGGEPFRAQAQIVTGDYFTTLGLRPAKGRLFQADEGTRAQPEAVVSHALWRRVLARRPLANSNLKINGHPFAVVGVAPAGFRGTQHEDDVDVWLPVEVAPWVLTSVTEADLRDPEKGWLFGLFGRLAPGTDVEHAQREMDRLASRMAEGTPQVKHPPALQLYPGLRIRPGTFGALVSPLALLSGVVTLLMLVVCANLGGLLLVKAAARQEEIGVRLALGVTRGQLVRQLLAESVTLSLIGGAVGFVLSLWTVDALQDLPLGQFLPRMRDLSMDGRIVAFTAVLSLGTGVLFGLVPALWSTRSTRRRVAPLLHRGGDPARLERGRARLQEIFVVGQVTVSLILLVTTGLFVRTLVNLRSIDPGFDSTNVLNVPFNLALRADVSEPAGRLFYDRVLANASKLPGVLSASLVSWVPMSKGNDSGEFTTLRSQSAGQAEERWSQYSVVVPGYFHSLRIPLLRGRDFSRADRQGSTPVLIVDETLAKLLWPGRNPLGERVDVKLADRREIREVIGVARRIRGKDLYEPPRPFFYLPLAQHYSPDMTLQVRTAKDPLRTADAVRSFLRRLDPNLGVKVSRYHDEVEEALAQPRLLSWLLGSFSATALLVTAIGLYGTLAYSVSRRTRELGIRIALGARSSEIVTMVLRRGLFLTLIGLVLGLIASVWATSLFSGFLFGVTPTDPSVFVSVALLLTLVGLAASSLPAYSATRVDPMAVIRHE
jgi:putative ABC transport system permease protein